MATTFTTWTELLGHLLNLYRSHSFAQASATIGGGHAVTWSSARELREAIDHARLQAELETGNLTFRVRLKDGGRG